MNLVKLAPWVAGGLALAGAVAGALPPGKARGFDVDGFARLPVLEGGRVKPFDSLARNSLLVIRGQQSFTYQGLTVSAAAWLLDVFFRPDTADSEPIFVINDPDVLGLMGVKQTAERYFSFRDMEPHLQEIDKQGRAAHAIESKQRTRFQSAIANLFERVLLYYKLRGSVQPLGGPPLAELIRQRGAPGAAESQQVMADLSPFRPLPPVAGRPADAWRNVGEALGAGGLDPALEPIARLGAAWTEDDSRPFNEAVASLKGVAFASSPEVLRQADREVTFNRAQPFYAGMVVYVLALLALFASWLWKPQLLQPAAFGLLSSAALIHTGGLVFRIIIQGRPPVTNLYSSAIFVGWAAVLVGIVLESIYRRGFGTAVAAASGFASLIVAHHLAGDGDTMEMMRAVLDSNFWLATHVVSITIGYSGTFLAGAIAIGYTLRKQLAKTIDAETSRALTSMAYGVVCFALLFSFVGTVLGGIWADQSWGRFWGWDPKENGALLIVLWNAIILHARWGGYARERGIMTMAIFGNVITSLSWFGVNMLGVGLHSYGFMDKAFWALSGFIASQALLMALCLAPRRFWEGGSALEKAEGKGPPAQPQPPKPQTA